ncbi:arginine, lysine, histidine permease Can1p [Yamadazyma tenuis ATCC 10573]|uniref:Arginine, lysine, histidine permease Can1p n=1 Tax=Candida tenuis (strain ATCC 10573 / BCRC 21748 / CBS 615 / JCM 9827 / NBRC 10315 / NRRL Y-1498 / VKM Y-70) TaxID=590646 RepID=G3BF41_CANTC|nr:arginine, lysine, histidine permease Can1p [Yamadazyma tenuis ATCC 10573]EGV60629.1 arginine, lysine, histidine permease Can1p [Yamadazyma tenuis ATCC 10573]
MSDYEKGPDLITSTGSPSGKFHQGEKDLNVQVQRQLKPRHISMIAIGGTIGTGLFVSTGGVLAEAGPVSSLISFIFIGTLVFAVIQGLGEMATYIPISGSFTQFTTRWCSPALGAANGYCYWFSWAITYALELSVVGQIIFYWTDAVPLGAWIGIFFVILTSANMFPVKFYGEIEFWISFLKVIAVFGWLIYALCIVCGAGKTGPIGFRYWRNPGPWGPGILEENINTARFLGWLSSLISAAFTFQGCELIGIASGEMKSPKSLPKAIRSIYIRIIVFYLLSMFFMGLLIPYTNPRLGGDGYAVSSPFVIAMDLAGTKVLPDIFNGVLLITIISAGNSNIYCGSRILYGLGQAGVGPKFFTLTTKHGVPYVAVIITSLFGLLAFLVLSENGSTVFDWLLNITAVAGLISWGWISVTHLKFMAILKQRGISRNSLPFKAVLMPYLSQYATITIFVLVFLQGFSCFWNITASGFFTSYISVILFVVAYIAFHFYFNGFGKRTFSKEAFWIPVEECDIDSGVREIDEYFVEPEPTNLWEKIWAVLA